MKLKRKKLMLILGCCLIYQLPAQTPTNTPIDPNWQLKWEDHFNFFDANKWLRPDYATHNDEPQLYLEGQTGISNGNLVIELKNIKTTCPFPLPAQRTWSCGMCMSKRDYYYISGWVETKGAYNTQFGYIEARIKFPYEKKRSLFPAFWTWLGADLKEYKNKAEIDICEIFGKYNNSNAYNIGVIREYDPRDAYGSESTTSPYSSFSYADWHTYAIEWDKNRIIWYCDGRVVHSLSNHRIVDPVRIIFNLALQSNNPPSSTHYMYVDYVKVYGLKCDKYTVVNEISDFKTYNYAVKKSITLSGKTTIPKNSNISLRANDFIRLEPGFYAPVGTNLYLDVSPCEGK